MGLGENVPRPVSSFEEAGFPEYIMESIRAVGFAKPTPIQCQVRFPPFIVTGASFNTNNAFSRSTKKKKFVVAVASSSTGFCRRRFVCVFVFGVSDRPSTAEKRFGEWILDFCGVG